MMPSLDYASACPWSGERRWRDARGWVKYEWMSFHDDILGGQDWLIVPVCIGDLDSKSLPPAATRSSLSELLGQPAPAVAQTMPK